MTSTVPISGAEDAEVAEDAEASGSVRSTGRGMFQGLSAFPLTPLREDQVDESSFRVLVRRLASSDVDSITVLGSTGSYAYLTREERKQVLGAGVAEAGHVPVFAGVGSLRTTHVLEFAEDAQNVGASALLLAPVSYQPLTDDEVYQLYADVTANISVPLIVYDNPRTTGFAFTDDVYASIARLPNVASIKIPGVPAVEEARARIEQLRRILPGDVTLGVSGDASGAAGLNAGCDVWYSVIAGVLPEYPSLIAQAAQAGDAALADRLSRAWQPLWSLFQEHGSLRVAAAIAENLGLVGSSCLPRPILGLGDEARAEVADVMDRLEIRATAAPR